MVSGFGLISFGRGRLATGRRLNPGSSGLTTPLAMKTAASAVTITARASQGRRWRRERRTWLALAVIVTALAAVFIASGVVNPLLPGFNLRPVASLPRPNDIKPKPLTIAANPSEQKAKRAQVELQHALATTKRVVPSKKPSQTAADPPPQIPAPAIPTSRPLAIGFYINWDESSYASLKR